MRNEYVAHAFYKGKKAKGSHFESTGTKLISYNTCIAQWVIQHSGEQSKNIILGNATKYSVSTSKHMHYIKADIDVWTTKNVPMGELNLVNYI